MWLIVVLLAAFTFLQITHNSVAIGLIGSSQLKRLRLFTVFDWTTIRRKVTLYWEHRVELRRLSIILSVIISFNLSGNDIREIADLQQLDERNVKAIEKHVNEVVEVKALNVDSKSKIFQLE